MKRFLNKEIGFLDIAGIVGRTLEKASSSALHSIEDVLACDREARRMAETL